MQLSDPINNIVLVPIYVRYSTFISTLWGYINGFPGTSFTDKIPYLVLKNVKKDCIVFMLLLLVKIRNIVGSSANRADGHIVFGFCFVFCFHPMCCGVAVITACSAQFADVTLCVVSKLQMSRCQAEKKIQSIRSSTRRCSGSG